jgi:hypothetical protein
MPGQLKAGEAAPWEPTASESAAEEPAAGEPPAAAGGRVGARRLTRTAIIGAAAAAILVVAGVSIAVAQTSPSSTTTSTIAPSAGPAKGGPGGFHGHKGFGSFGSFGGPGRFGMNGVIHGEFVRPNGSGGYQTVDFQTGQVTSVSSSSITLKSADGFSKSYSVTTNTLVDAGRDGIGNVKKGDNAQVNAVVNSSTAEAQNINDLTNLSTLRQHWAPPQPSTTPSRAATSST